jgi:hypothetical protein
MTDFATAALSSNATMTTRSTFFVALALVTLSACDFADKSIGNEIVAGTSESGSSGAAEPATTEEEGDDDGGNVDDGMPAGSSDDAAADDSPSDPGCVLDDYFDEVGIGNYLCGYTPYGEDLELTHDCLLEYMADTRWVLALWTSPEEPVMVALLGETGPNGYVVTWYEQREGIVSSWTCAEVVDTPDCTVAPAEMCLTCVEPGAPTVLCPQ